MDFDKIIDRFITEAAKILHMDNSMSAFHQKMQDHVRVLHRVMNPESDSYYDYPYVRDMFGDQESGQVIYTHKGQHFMADYKSKSGAIELSKHRKAKQSYVADGDATTSPLHRSSESAALTTESGTVEETTVISEAAIKGSGPTFRMKLIAPGKGSMGYYTVESLKQAAADKIFHKGLQNFFDHPTEDETERSGTGSTLKLASVLESDAVYEEDGVDGPGLYADVKAFADTKPFLVERWKNIGNSIRAAVVRSKEKLEGVPIVNRFAKALSVDYVSMPGAGGKLVTLYESFKADSQHQAAKPDKENKPMAFEVNEQEYRQLTEAVKLIPGLKVTVDRLTEENGKLKAGQLVAVQIQESNLPPRAQKRVMSFFSGPAFIVPTKDGALDVAALQESVKKQIEEEEAYLKESGVTVASPVVRMPNGTAKPVEQGDPKILEEAGKALDSNLDVLCGVKK
jgi:hypothetical protein